MKIRFIYSAVLTGLLFCYSCKNMQPGNHGPIVLGDSSTIVTETDPHKLQDLVTDLHPDIPSRTAEKDTEAAAPAAKDTAKPATTTAAQQQPTLSGNGLKAEFKEVAILIPNVSAKQAGRANLKHANGAVYTLNSGTLNNNTLTTSGNVTKVSQRYQTAIMLKSNGTNMLIEQLSNTTDWEALKGGNGQYRIAGLDPHSLEYSDARPSAIRSAVERAARRRRFSRHKTQELVSSVHHVRSANQKPLYVMLHSVMWKIDGKDANGRAYSKQVRVDMPL